jgi:environmental stress-induced protein Ves
VALLNHIYGLLDNREKSRLIWLHGTAGVGKSAVAFTVAERMRGLKVAEQTTVEKRLAATFFFSRKHTQRCTTGYFFATLAYQLACNFPSIREDVNTAIRENPGLLHPDKSPHAQMDALFLRPLRELRFRLRECPPLVFVIDALDECTSETEIADLIALLGHALHQLDQPDLPVIHILLTSRSEAHIGEAMYGKDVHSLVCEIPVKTSGKGIASTISLDGTDVDNDIYIFLEHSFRKLQSRHPGFPLPTTHQLARLASRAGRRFIVASTMIKFIDDGYNDPRDRLQLMLDLTSNLLPGTEVYKLYDHILSTCTDPKRAYLHLSIVSSLADPLPISQISNLLGPGEGKDVESSLIQLRSVMDIPTDSSLPVNIHHSSVRDYVSDPSNCSLLEGHHITSPDSLLARSSLRLMVQDMPENTAFLDAFSELSRQSRAMRSNIPQMLQHTLSFIVLPPEPLQILLGLLWLRGDRSYDPYPCQWLETPDGHAWLQTQEGKMWLQSHWARDWLWHKGGKDWLQTRGGEGWLQTQGERGWLQTQRGNRWLQTQDKREWLQIWDEEYWLRSEEGQDSPQSEEGQHWPQSEGQRWIQCNSLADRNSMIVGLGVQFSGGAEILHDKNCMQDWLQTQGGQAWATWLQTMTGQNWLWTKDGKDWLQTHSGQAWLQTRSGRNWLQTEGGQVWLQTSHGQAWQSTPAASVWVTMEEFSTTLEDINEYTIAKELHLLPTFQVIQQFKSLPDFLMFPVFLALRHQDQSSTSALPQVAFPPNAEVVHAMRTFMYFAEEAQEQSQTASAALRYACQNWAVHLLRTQNPWDDTLNHIFKTFWDRHLLSWLERQWCLKGLQSCLVILSAGQRLAKVCVLVMILVTDLR